MTRTPVEWANILTVCGVRRITAIAWSLVFAKTITERTFSRGESELLDFLPTVLHESQMLERLIEDGSYSAARIREIGSANPDGSRWRSLVPLADRLAYKPAAFFEAVYGGRLGNDVLGDGARYPGRGIIMLTGKANYRWQGARSGQDLVALPELAEQPHFALEFAVDWWEGRVPDEKLGDTRAIRKVVNGAYIGLADVERLAAKVRQVMVIA